MCISRNLQINIVSCVEKISNKLVNLKQHVDHRDVIFASSTRETRNYIKRRADCEKINAISPWIDTETAAKKRNENSVWVFRLTRVSLRGEREKERERERVLKSIVGKKPRGRREERKMSRQAGHGDGKNYATALKRSHRYPDSSGAII